MNIHLEELAYARAYAKATAFQSLSKDQVKSILDKGRFFHRWFRAHRLLHGAISATVLTFILAADLTFLFQLPRFFLDSTRPNPFVTVLIASLVVGSLHSWLLYSLVVYSLHEGAAHKLIFPSQGIVSRALHFLSSNLCRLASADPIYYAQNHMAHHAEFGTEHDGEFLSFVLRRRYWMTFFPFAMFLNYSDFVVHRPLSYTPSKVVSMLTAIAYNTLLGHFMARSFGLLFTLLTLVLVLPHFGFYVDRLRQFTEHNLMPLNNKDGARSFGTGFWGLLIGGGPWGQPCHLIHHLVPSIPWYQQLLLHRHFINLLTPTQRQQYLLEPVIGYPRLVWRLWREPHAFARRLESTPVTGAPILTRAKSGDQSVDRALR